MAEASGSTTTSAAPGAVYTEDTDPDCIPDDVAAEMLRDAPWRRIALVGDSTAHGAGDPSPGYREMYWAPRVLQALRTAVGEVEFLNTGRINATTRQVIDEQLDAALAFEPDLLYVACGGNDLWTDTPDYEAAERNLDRIFAAGVERGARVATMTIADAVPQHVPELLPFRERLDLLNQAIRRAATRHDAILIDLWWHPVGHRSTVMSADNIHFNVSGHAVVAAEVVKALSAAAR
ncbi:lysophospholipase L1-like esterase [Nocardia transvalensis]|uniref:Lysophospholipase L1-like esterase n=1 Tax=Nocardia transvalensis TaxID=37333 RepID=A0A7W9ULI4_9NOCA|nr:SGNH/GDSL hydrolase family protein [Nocardia transvalensis]MBB5917598.1 lysophospholipase L1-like esterase [Nocardia transvalensis]